jgi:hypothetical protein
MRVHPQAIEAAQTIYRPTSHAGRTWTVHRGALATGVTRIERSRLTVTGGLATLDRISRQGGAMHSGRRVAIALAMLTAASTAVAEVKTAEVDVFP